MKKTILLSLLFFLANSLYAQIDSTSKPKNGYSHKYEGQFEIGFIAGNFTDFNGNPQNPISAFTLQIFQGYRWSQYVALGLRTGLDWYNTVVMMPIKIAVQGDLLSKRFSPTYFAELGYGAGWLNRQDEFSEVDGGFTWGFGAGFRVLTGNKTAFTFGLGFRNQKVITREIFWGGEQHQEINFRRISFQMGFRF